MNSRHPFTPLRLLVAAAVLSTLGAAIANGSTPLVVRIAHVGALSGGAAHFGRDNENGVRLAIEELNRSATTLGGRPVRWELVAEDDAADPRQATQVAQKLCDQGVHGVVGHMNSGTAIPASRIYADCGLPNVTASATNPRLTQAGHRTTFRVIADDDALGGAMAELAAAQGFRRVAVIDDRTAYGQGVAAVFKRRAQALGLSIVGEHFTSDKAVDFSALLTSVKAQQPQALFFGGMDAQAGPMLRQMDALGLSALPVLGGDGLCSARLPELAAGAKALAGVRCAEGGASLAKMPGGAAWKQRYDARFPGQFQVYSPYTYDATMVLAAAMQRAGSSDPRRYGPLLAQTQLSGVTGRIAFDAQGNLRQPATTAYAFRDGRKVPL